jgi:DNA mismatch repair protein MutL
VLLTSGRLRRQHRALVRPGGRGAHHPRPARGAHERILYERLSGNLRAEAVPLPNPVVAQLPEDLAPEAWNFEAEMEALGFRFEPFGEGALRITAVPETVTDPEIALLAALHALAGGEG